MNEKRHFANVHVCTCVVPYFQIQAWVKCYTFAFQANRRQIKSVICYQSSWRVHIVMICTTWKSPIIFIESPQRLIFKLLFSSVDSQIWSNCKNWMRSRNVIHLLCPSVKWPNQIFKIKSVILRWPLYQNSEADIYQSYVNVTGCPTSLICISDHLRSTSVSEAGCNLCRISTASPVSELCASMRRAVQVGGMTWQGNGMTGGGGWALTEGQQQPLRHVHHIACRWAWQERHRTFQQVSPIWSKLFKPIDCELCVSQGGLDMMPIVSNLDGQMHNLWHRSPPVLIKHNCTFVVSRKISVEEEKKASTCSRIFSWIKLFFAHLFGHIGLTALVVSV